MKIHIYNRQKDLQISRPALRNAVKEALLALRVECDELCLHFVTVKEISALHARYFNDQTATDCISFPLDNDDRAGYSILGEVFVCPQVAIDYATKHRGDPQREMLLYVIHGLLHLVGYDDIAPTERRRMRAAERRLMRRIFSG